MMGENGLAVENRYTGRKIGLTTKEIRRSLGRATSAAATANARAAAKAGESLASAVPINVLQNTGKAAHGTCAMVSYLYDAKHNKEHIAVLTVEQRSGNVVGIEAYDTLRALNIRKRNVVDQKVQTVGLPQRESLTSTTRSSETSLSDFLNIVKETHQSLLSEDALW